MRTISLFKIFNEINICIYSVDFNFTIKIPVEEQNWN